MSFSFDEDQRALADGVEDLLAAKATGPFARAVAAGEADWRELWDAVAELGIPAMAVPEERGGLGLGPVELVAVCERAGRHLAPGPLVATAGGFVPTAVAAGGEAAAELERIAGDGARATLVLADPRSPDASLGLDGDRLAADSVLVPDAERVDLFGFVIEDETELSLAVLPADAAEIVPVEGLDRTRPPALVSASAPAAVTPLPRGRADLSVAYATAAAELVGLASRLLELSVRQAREREQFGAPIGSFQAVKHRLADSFVELERARSLVYRAAVLSAGTGAPGTSDADELRAARMAFAAGAEAATEVGRSAVQVHGGVGITVEHDVSLFYLRARQASMQLGGADASYAALVDSAAAAAAVRGATG